MKRLVLLVLVGVILLGVTPVLADGDFYVIAGGGGGVGIKITSLPYTISAPGFYYLTGNLNAATGDGITVNSDNVTLDLMGFCLTGSSGGKGILTVPAHSNLEIRNGTLSGWGFGIDLAAVTGTNSIRVMNIRVVGCNTGGIRVGGSAVGTLVKGCTVADATADFGISIDKGAIIGNTVTNCGTAICLGTGSIVGNNIFTNSGQTGISLTSYGGLNYILVDQNTVNGGGLSYSGPGANTVKYGHNAFNGAGVP